MITKKHLKSIKYSLKGNMKNAADYLGVSHSYVSMILSGRRKNIDLLIDLKRFGELKQIERKNKINIITHKNG